MYEAEPSLSSLFRASPHPTFGPHHQDVYDGGERDLTRGNLGPEEIRSAGQLEAVLARLPWAASPPREPLSPLFPQSASDSLSSSQPTPRYSFLASDPTLLDVEHQSRRNTFSTLANTQQNPSPPSTQDSLITGGSASFSPSQLFFDPPRTAIGENQESTTNDTRSIKSAWSGMAEMEFEMSSESVSLSAPGSRKSSTRSNRSRSSSRFKSRRSKRASTLTNYQRLDLSRWDIETNPLVGDHGDFEMDLRGLIGRAAVLERLLRAGKRISESSVRTHLSFNSASIHRHHTLSSKHTSISATTSAQRAPKSSLTPSHSSRTSYSLRQRLSRRIRRTHSREDAFTEILSDHEGADDDEDDPNLFPAETLVDRMSIDDSTGRGGVVTLSEIPSRSPSPPPLPPKDTPIIAAFGRLRRTTVFHVRGTTAFHFLTPAGPNHEPYVDLEKAQPRVPQAQSPHIGHHSPDWRKRRSVVSYITTGQWSVNAKKRWGVAVGVGAGIMLILIVGLLAGLLARRTN
ncbi:hypothetical protein BCR39DRAFT_530002 [Naematelia encephala]|uniref:Uncharacterized protein n=1 Tax=Naematelia encephala TaxID=71784 RepID=A0A1Y2B693_9TREE|nr:hypothetical protein BCR39DRAFT_530002 [Naematelia encephala]